MKSRIGIFGGTFDPIHNTHCDVARAALHQAHLETVHFVVAARPPHKETGAWASPEERFAMVEAAVLHESSMEASRVEMDREGPSYTADTVREFQRRYPEADLFLIIGMDSLVDLPKWREPEVILGAAHLLVVPRVGLNREPPPELEGKYTVLDFNATDLSSTEVRERIAAGLPFTGLVPAAVEALIEEEGIYSVGHV